MIRLIVFLGLIITASSFGFGQSVKKSLIFEVDMYQHEIGVLDPLFLNINLGNKGKHDIMIFPPDGRTMLIEVRRNGGEKWWSIELFKGYVVGENDFKVPISPGYSSTIPQKLSAPRDSAEFTWMPAKNPEYLFFNNYCFRPGKYELRVKYFYNSPYPDRRKKKPVIRVVEFEITDYKDAVDKKAYEWLMKLEHPGLFYNPEVAIYPFDRWLDFGEDFLQLFPHSRFSPFVHYGMVVALAYLRSSEEWDEAAFKYHRSQVRKSQNPYLIREIERYYQF